MDKYKENFEKGATHYIKMLEEINWFDNPHVKKEEVINNLNKSTFPPYFGTYLRQLGFTTDYEGQDQLEDVLNATLEFIPNSSFEINEDGLLIKVNGNEYILDIDINEFEAGEGEEGFVETELNEILEKENIEYRFYNLPPDDETCSFIYTKPEIYKNALEKGIIPDFMGYYAVNY
jgi:hypothetical protein